MNKRSVKKARPAKASRSTGIGKASVRKTSARKASAHKVSTHKGAARKAPVRQAMPVGKAEVAATVNGGAVAVTQVVTRSSGLRTHKYRVGQTVFYTSSPISRPGASGSYQVVRLLPSDGEDYQYRIKNEGEAFERVAKESQLEVEH
jgi:hypothetical protein